MRLAAPNVASLYGAAGSTLVYCLKVVRRDGTTVGFSNCDARITVGGLVYEPGFEPSDMVSTSGLAVDNLEVQVIPDETTLTEPELLAGLWDYAKFTIFEVDRLAPDDGSSVMKRGTTGEAQIVRGSWTIEFRGLKQAFQQNLGIVTTKTCRHRLGDAGCKVDLAPWTHTYAVTSAASSRVFTCSGAGEVAEYYKEGVAKAVTGANGAGAYERKIKSFAGGVFTLGLAMPFPVAPGDTFTFIAGCQKRVAEDCKNKFNNVLNFGGEPHVPGADKLTADPVVGVAP